jgi:hypothetical protein
MNQRGRIKQFICRQIYIQDSQKPSLKRVEADALFGQKNEQHFIFPDDFPPQVR